MSRRILAVIVGCWAALLLVAIWMFVHDQKGPVLAGLAAALWLTPFFVGFLMWRNRNPY
jgi:hypothetical protein